MKLFLFLLLNSIGTLCLAQHWSITELHPMPESVSNNAVCEGFVNGVPYVYSFAGIDSTKIYSGIHNRSYRYNTQTDTWESIGELPDTLGKIAASASRVGDIIYIIGGYHVFENDSEISSNRVHRYHIPSNTFLEDATPIPIPIDDQVQVVYKDSLIYVITGWSNNGNVANVQIYDPANNTWQVGTPLEPVQVPVFGAAGTILDDTIYFHGGARTGNFAIQVLLRKGAINPDNPTEINWSRQVINSKTYRAAATTSNGLVYFLGGADNTYNFDGIAYNNGQGVQPNNRSTAYRPIDGQTDHYIAEELPMDLRGIADVSENTKYLAGGMLTDQTVTNKVWRLDWQDIPLKVFDLRLVDFQLNVFPNPATDFIQIKIPEPMNCKLLDISVIDQRGKVLISKNENHCEQFNLDLSAFSNGTYFILIKNEDQSGAASFVIAN